MNNEAIFAVAVGERTLQLCNAVNKLERIANSPKLWRWSLIYVREHDSHIECDTFAHFQCEHNAKLLNSYATCS